MSKYTDREKKLVDYFEVQRGPRKFSDVVKEGFHPATLRSLVEAGALKKTDRGIYCLANGAELSQPDLVMAALKVPKGVICLISALSFYQVTDEIPRWVDMALPKGAWENKVEYPPVRYFHFSGKAWEEGVGVQPMDGQLVKIYTLEKTLADCFKFRNRIGLDVATNALKEAIRTKRAKPQTIYDYAKICRVDKVLKPYLEALR
ncbi:MAG: hypothetical protein A2Y02_03305 [Omnitrophica bacterium GWA2_52_12]|nr:MAG: hypothetical protein A2Y02_03305 [Omnitrophica bacterium GWA2_52_12]